jgi:oligopeptide transport system substrate-binding protein
MSNVLFRNLVPLSVIALFAAIAVWAVSQGTLPPADLTMCNGTEIKTIDPAQATDQPSGRVIDAIFEGLCRRHPKDLRPIPGIAERWEKSDDLRTYTFHLRKNAQWSDGSPVTAEDFFYSYRRFLSPSIPNQYAYQLWYVKNARRYTTSKVEVGEQVEVELPRAAGVVNTVRGEVLVGTLKAIDGDDDAKVYTVEIAGKPRRFYKGDNPVADAEPCAYLLPSFESVGIRVIDPYTLVIELDHPTPYFLDILAFYPLRPVHRKCLETHGIPAWTRPENAVVNGPFRVESRRIRDRVRLVKNERYWNRDEVRLNVVDVLAVEGTTAMLNLYLTGAADWIDDVPTSVAPTLMKTRPKEFDPEPTLGVYFYRLNTRRPPLDKPAVRRALALTINREEIVKTVTRTGQVPAFSLVPPGLAGYKSSTFGEENLAEAKQLLADAGFADGRGFPEIEILYNTHEAHKTIAELIQDRWKQNLGIDVGLRNQEFAVQLDTIHSGNYDLARAAWIGDYADPNTFLDMFVTDGENNETGWSNAEYDRLLREATSEGDSVKRMQILHDAETILMRELPVIPIYFYVSKDMIRTYVHGFHHNLRDEHPLWALSVDQAEKQRVFSEGAR